MRMVIATISRTGVDDNPTNSNDHPLPTLTDKEDETLNENGEGKYGS